MSNTRRLRLLCLAVVLAVLCVGCGSQSTSNPGGAAVSIENDKGEAYMLNQRQKDILREQGLPTDYESLTVIQKSAIEAIEDMLSYLEQKYHITVQYDSYVSSGGGETEHLVASCDAGLITVYRRLVNNTFVYEDNYLSLTAVPLYEKAIDDFLAGKMGEENIRIFSTLTDTEAGADEGNILSKTTATSIVFAAGDFSNGAFRECVEAYGAWLKDASNGHASVTHFVLITREELNQTFAFNYEQRYLSLTPIEAITCEINTSGTVRYY